jgi:hypothetical protein
MANWYGAARSNYVRIKDMEGLKKALEPFQVVICRKSDECPELVCFLSTESDSGGWPGSVWVTKEVNGESIEDEIEFDPSSHICPFMEEDQILVTMEAGAEKLRYISGQAAAWNANGDCCVISLDDIYKRAAERFHRNQKDITCASH